MKFHDHLLERLLNSARQAPMPPEAKLSWTAELSVLAEWRKARTSRDFYDWLPLLHRAVAVACVVALISVLASLSFEPVVPPSDELSSLNEVVNAAAAWL